MDNQGVLAVISGFSGAGKGTLMRALLERYDNYALSISATTRAPREGEVDGREYFFKTREEFEQMIEHDELVEYAQYVGNYYGTPKEYVFSNLKAGKDVLLEIEIQGALKIKKKFPEAVLIFVTPPSAGELRNRLAGRGTETPEKIAARLSRAAEESKQMDDYDFILVNDEVDRCVEEMHALIQAMHARTENHKTLIEKIKEEMKQLKGERCIMMLRPSYLDLVNVVNKEAEPGKEPLIQSRYSIVIATAKRARQLIAGDEALVIENGRKPLSIAIDELYHSKVKIVAENDSPEEEV